MNSTDLPKSYRGLGTKELARMIFKGELPENSVRDLPAQSLYMAARYNGLAASAEIVELASIEQCRVMLDLDLWDKDHFNQENIWEWLALTDETNDLGLLQKFLKFVDLKLLALIFQQHVHAEHFEEATDLPPGPQYYTPDQGKTWIHIKLEDKTKHFLLGRLLALIFETDPDLLYQLLGVSVAQTEAMLEEESYNDRLRRLSSEGMPDLELAYKICSPYPENLIKADLAQTPAHLPIKNINIVEPIVYVGQKLEPLDTFLSELQRRDEVESELTLIMNAAIVRFGLNFYQQEEVIKLAQQVRGAINLGLEVIRSFSDSPSVQIFEALGIKKIFSLALSKLIELKKSAEQVRHTQSEKLFGNQIQSAIVEAASLPIPAISDALASDGSIKENAEGGVSIQTRAIEHESERRMLLAFLSKI